MAELNAMIVWLVAGKLHYCEAEVMSTDQVGLNPAGISPSSGTYAPPNKVSVGVDAMQAAMAKLDALRMNELGITGQDIADTRPPAGPWEA